MLTLLSPAKKQEDHFSSENTGFTKPQAIVQIKLLISQLKKCDKKKLGQLMSISEKLAELNHERFQSFNPNQFTLKNSTPAIYAFRGDAYQALNVDDFNKNDLKFMQQHLIILSGLYGYLRPLDFIQAYRLEMKTRLKTEKAEDLYQFWGGQITKALNRALQDHKNKTVINLASNEYFKAIDPLYLEAEVIDVHFKELKNGSYKTIGIHAKRAREMMTRHIMKNHIDDVEELQQFNGLNYRFSKQHSSDQNYVFIR